MGVVMRGGTSGNREDGLPSVPTKDGEYTYGKQAPSLSSGVTMKGGTSGDDNSYLPDTTVAFSRQVPQDTSGGSAGSNVQWTQCSGNREGDKDPPVPGSGSPDDSAA